MKVLKWISIGAVTILTCVGGATLFVSYFDTHDNSYESNVRLVSIHLDNIAHIMNLYRDDHGKYPDEINWLETLSDESWNKHELITNVSIEPWGKPYSYSLVKNKGLIWSNGSNEQLGIVMAKWIEN